MLATLGLSGLFRVLVTRDEVRRTKPAPDCYLRAASLLGQDPARCAAVEDAPYGVQAASSAGMHVLAVTTSYPAERLGQAHRLFTTVPQAIRWLKARVA
jgi:beta-phosphoglucomutase-like phosphatase (HAD superfamily)